MITENIRGWLGKFKLAALLRNVQFPITNQELVEFAEEHNAPETVIELMNRLPDRAFESVSEVLEHLRGQPAPSQ